MRLTLTRQTEHLPTPQVVEIGWFPTVTREFLNRVGGGVFDRLLEYTNWEDVPANDLARFVIAMDRYYKTKHGAGESVYLDAFGMTMERQMTHAQNAIPITEKIELMLKYSVFGETRDSFGGAMYAVPTREDADAFIANPTMTAQQLRDLSFDVGDSGPTVPLV